MTAAAINSTVAATDKNADPYGRVPVERDHGF
jgi:hypothetical protein